MSEALPQKRKSMEGLWLGYLADHPNLIPKLTDWFVSYWGGERNPAITKGSAAEALSSRLHKDRVPLSLIAFRDEETVGTASLKLRELAGYEHYEHWLGSVYVAEQHRGAGIGTLLYKCAASKAAQLGIPRLHLYAPNSLEDFYAKIEWQTIERISREGKQTIIMAWDH